MIDPTEIVLPSAPVADATARIMSRLVEKQERDGLEAAQVEALAMCSAGFAVLHDLLGAEAVTRMIAIAISENRLGEGKATGTA